MHGPLLLPFRGASPEIAASAFVAPGACLIGAVRILEGANIWFNAVLRADIAAIVIGPGSSIQDGTVVHVDPDGPCIVGERVVVGHNAVLHACTIDDGCLIGMGAVLLSGCRVGRETVVAAGSLVRENAVLESGHLYAGNPARKLRPVPERARERMQRGADLYAGLLPDYTSSQQ